MINSDYNLNKYQFLQATTPKNNYKTQGMPQNGGQIQTTQPYHQAQQVATPSIKPSVGIPSQKDMETAMAFLEGLEASGVNPYEIASANVGAVNNTKGPAFDGFVAPQNNGTGDLQPETRDEEHGKKLYFMG